MRIKSLAHLVESKSNLDGQSLLVGFSNTPTGQYVVEHFSTIRHVCPGQEYTYLCPFHRFASVKKKRSRTSLRLRVLLVRIFRYPQPPV